MEIIAVSNIKGGVGKTTTAVNLAYLSGAAGWRTLIWDLDPQGAATFLLGDGAVRPHRARDLVRGRVDADELIVRTAFPDLHLLPADLSLRRADEQLSNSKHPTRRLLKMSRSLRGRFAALYIDCPPGISLLSENVLRAADAIVIPIVPSPLSLRMLDELERFLEDRGWEEDLLLLPFFSMVDRRRSLHDEMIETARARFPRLLRTEVPYWSEIERMSERRAPLPAYSPRSPASAIYRTLWGEIETRLQRARG